MTSILLEGLDGVGKTTQCALLAQHFGATLIKTPPTCIAPVRDYFVNKSRDYRESYYMVGNYLSSEEIKRLINSGERESVSERVRPLSSVSRGNSGANVVIDRFYPSTIAYLYGKDRNHIITDEPWPWPDMLHRPTYCFYLRMDNDARLARLAGRGDMNPEEIYIKNNPEIAERINQMYEQLGCTAIDIEPEWDQAKVLEEILKRMV